MKSFDNRVEYQGFAERQGYQPDQLYDVAPLLRQNLDKRLRNLDNIRQTSLEDFKRDKQGLANLAQFSETLMETLTTAAKEKGQRDMEEGLQQAYLDGISKDTVESFNAGEDTVLKVGAAAKTAAYEQEQRGASVDVVRQIRSFGGWKGYGYAMGLAQQGAAFYPRFYAQAAQQVSLNINGEEVTLATAKSGPERAAVETEIRGQFLSRFSGMNPALLNKYLFPAMRQYENQAAVEWADKQQKILQEERKAEAQDFLYNGIKAGMGGEAFINFINTYAGDFGGVGVARRVGIEILQDLINSRQIKQAEVDAIKNYEFKAKDGSMRKIGEYWGRDFTKVDDLLYEANRVDLQRDVQRQQDAQAEFKLLFDQQTAEKRQRGERWTEAELAEIGKNWEEQGLGPVPDYVKDEVSREDQDDKDAIEDLKRKRQARDYLTEEDLRGVSPEVYAQFIGYVKADEDLAKPSEEVAKEAKDEITAMVDERFKVTDGQAPKTPEWQRTRNDAVNAYARYYRENIRKGMTPDQADSTARQRVQANITAGSYGKVDPNVDQAARQLQEQAMSFLDARGKDSIYTEVIPGTNAALAQARTYADTRRGDLPLIYKQLAARTRGVTAWDIADAQLKASGHPGLLKPRVVQAVDQMDPSLRPLLTWRPTAARANRVALQTGWKQMLDLIASQESTSYGGYDAMNTGGNAGGTTAYGSANSVNVFGRGLSTMTIGEVRALQRKGSVHAAGRYQIIQTTLNELMDKTYLRKYHNLTDDSPFNAQTQDALAIALAKNRLTQGNKLTAFRNEWVGLNKVSDRVLQQAINNLNSTSPFNQTENLLPRLVYRIGNRGYGSTGPHLDVKPVAPGTTQTSRNLPAMTATQLDQYVVVGSRQLPLSKGTTTTDDNAAHGRRGSFGHDFAADDGTPVYLKNGARVVGTFKGDGGTDHTIIELPDGRRYQFLHGLNA